jgi:epsilon-lactone hydrolase
MALSHPSAAQKSPARTDAHHTRKRKGGFTLSGRPAFRRRSLFVLMKVTVDVSTRRMFKGPLLPGWSWNLETANAFLQEQMKYAFTLPNVTDAREYLDSLLFAPIDDPPVIITPTRPPGPRGNWFVPEDHVDRRTLLYLHGGGYAFHSHSHEPMIALFAAAAKARTFALDYRLTPEHPHPAQLEDALSAYRRLLAQGTDPSQLVIAGDSAGGHLTLMLLIEIRKLGLPRPAGAIGICPYTHVGRCGASLFGNDPYDWVQGAQAVTFGEWLRGNTSVTVEALSPVYADLTGLPPIYVQAGDKEILYDMIQEFVGAARRQGADITCDVWKNMTHDFQAYGSILAESREALQKFGDMIARWTGAA